MINYDDLQPLIYTITSLATAAKTQSQHSKFRKTIQKIANDT